MCQVRKWILSCFFFSFLTHGYVEKSRRDIDTKEFYERGSINICKIYDITFIFLSFSFTWSYNNKKKVHKRVYSSQISNRAPLRRPIDRNESNWLELTILLIFVPIIKSNAISFFLLQYHKIFPHIQPI